MSDIDDGVVLLSQDDWYKLQVFCLISMHSNPRTDDKMAVALGLNAEDREKHWDKDFTETAKDYDELAGHCDKFWNHIRPGMVDLVNDIVQYQATMDAFFKRLIETIDAYDVGQDVEVKLVNLWNDWKSPAPSEKATTVKNRFISAASRLRQEAAGRSDKADGLRRDMDGFHSNIVKSKGTFESKTKNFENKYGATSKEMEDLGKRLNSLNDELNAHRKKERDEIIVLGTSPVYLILWPIGPLIMAGVQIGVGVDLALVRAKIDQLVGDVADAQKRMNSKQKFNSSYGFIKGYTEKTERQITEILPAVAKLKDGWTTIAKDLQGIVDLLTSGSGDAKKEDWFAFATSLEATRKQWKFVAARADKFRLHATVREVPNIDEFIREAEKAA